MTLTPYTNTNGLNSKVANGQLPDAQYVKAILPPFGSIQAWHKEFGSLTTGSADTDTTNKLVDSSATFITDGVVSGMIVKNTSSGNYAIVDTVESETSILLKADTRAGSSNADIFPSGTESYNIFVQRELPDAYVEANGQTISDTDSLFNGETLPDLNGSSSSQRFLRGSISSGTTGGSDTKDFNHTHGVSTATTNSSTGGNNPIDSVSVNTSTTLGSSDILPSYFEIVWIIRIK